MNNNNSSARKRINGKSVKDKKNKINKKQETSLGIHFWIFYIVIVLICFSLICYVLYIQNPELFGVKDEVEHNIYIVESDTDFHNYSSISGSGTLHDPYVLEDINFDTWLSRIEIKNTRSHFQIKNCRFTGADEPSIYIDDSSSIHIYENHFKDTNRAIEIQGQNKGAHDIIIEKNNYTNIYQALSLHLVNNCQVINNTFLDCRDAIIMSIFSYQNDENVISGNNILNSMGCIHVSGGSTSYEGPECVYIENNYIKNSTAFELKYLEIVEMQNNTFKLNRRFTFNDVDDLICKNNYFEIVENHFPGEIKKIRFDHCSNILFQFNFISSIEECIQFLDDNEDFRFINNQFNGNIGLNFTGEIKNVIINMNCYNCSNNVKLTGDITGELPIFDNGSIGNYWNDYNGLDLDGDGIGDDPYLITRDLYDNFPITNPNLILIKH
jgi:nitrous oxidase accessory protein NosD